MSILGTEFDSAVERLKKAATDFMGIYQQFVNIPYQYRTDNWQSVKDRADYVQGVIGSITNAVDSAYRWAASAFGLEGLAGLGFALPAAVPITVAAIAAGISTIMVTYGYMTEELNKSALKKRVTEENIARADQGLPPLPEGTYVQDQTMFGNLTTAVKWAAIGGLLIFVAPKVLEKLKRN